ncbi:MAG: ABC transporter substrate-binding protein [Firmicutes bacterium]|nr:ABC transporter substrate-binding protein [Bacillota bacterium]
MKKTFAVLICCFLAAGALACGKNNHGEDVNISLTAVDGAPILTLAKMRAEDFAVANGYRISYTVTNDSDALVAALLNRTADFAITPINIAAMMHNNGSGYRLAAVTTWGIMHIVSNQNVSSLEELKGETIVAFGKSGTPGITLRAVLEQNGIEYAEPIGTNYAVDPNKVHIIYLTAASDVRNAIVAGTLDGITVKFGLLAEPVATAVGGATAAVPHGQFTVKINLQTEWAKNNGGEIYPQAALIFHERLLAKDQKFVDQFIAMAELSSLYANAYPESAGSLAVQSGSIAIPNGAVVKTAYDAGRLPIEFARAPEAKSRVNAYLQVILNDTPALVGGKMPSDSFYYAA